MDNQEFNNQGEETTSSIFKNPLVIIAIIVVIALVIFAVIGLSVNPIDTETPTDTEGELTDEELAELEQLLQAPTDTPEMTDEDMAELEELLQAPAETPDLTPEEQAELEELLSQ